MHHILIDCGLNHFWASFTLWMITIINTALFFTFHGDISNTASMYVYIGMFIAYMIIAYYLKRKSIAIKEKKKVLSNPSYEGKNI